VTGNDLPLLRTELPGPQSRAWVDRLAARECPGVTARRARRAAALGASDTDPVVWSEALGSNVLDVDGNVLVDLCAGFGVAALGHRHPAIVAAGQAQLARLPHAMGDAFPDVRRIELMERLCALTGMDRVLFGSSGSDAVEAAIKTARLATGRSRILSFEGGYHGLASAPLAVIGYHVEAFQGPFQPLLGTHGDLAPWGGGFPDLRVYAAVLVEPLQGRGGMRAPPAGWLAALHAAASAAGTLVIHDEIYCGFGRAGDWLAGSPLQPDLLCVGKSLAGGYPISACLGTAAAMDAWGASKGEAIHTQTFLGNPVGCAMALASLEEMERIDLPARVRETGAWLTEHLLAVPGVHGVTGRGLMLGVRVDHALALMRAMQARGYLVLPAGEHGEVLGFTPPLTTSREVLAGAVEALRASIAEGRP
jgi:4-aminobutyrate aminotransferase-like enzyme